MILMIGLITFIDNLKYDINDFNVAEYLHRN